MGRDDTQKPARLNWVVILSLGGSLAASLALWAALIRGIEALVR